MCPGVAPAAPHSAAGPWHQHARARGARRSWRRIHRSTRRPYGGLPPPWFGAGSRAARSSLTAVRPCGRVALSKSMPAPRSSSPPRVHFEHVDRGPARSGQAAGQDPAATHLPFSSWKHTSCGRASASRSITVGRCCGSDEEVLTELAPSAERGVTAAHIRPGGRRRSDRFSAASELAMGSSTFGTAKGLGVVGTRCTRGWLGLPRPR